MTKKKSIKQAEDVCFEEALGKLEIIVKQLEKGELALEDSLEKFSEGISLSQHCLAKLVAAEEKIDKIVKCEQGIWTERDLVYSQEGSK